MATPAERYRPSPRSFPDVLPAIEYAPGDQVRKVDRDSFISFRNRPWRLGKAFRGELVALRPTAEDGVFSAPLLASNCHPEAAVGFPCLACNMRDRARRAAWNPVAIADGIP
ncbi:hypothetical protein [Mesorhizobium sp. WSM3882]|uniref:hypothetical protein n=1 Tax=Mesorhizobium sp. WSM3882 TaxID=2029407 RepID=UPI001FDA91EE|nr:hypothetical protein [Mesorhizobium sp. WSM3882]